VAELGVIPARSYGAGKAIDSDLLVRSVLLAAVFLALWISFQPFRNIEDAAEVSDAGTIINQVGYSAIFVMLAVWCIGHQPGRLLLLVRPILIATLLWLVFSVAISWEPLLSLRRLSFTFATIGVAAMTMLLPRSVRHFSEILAAVVLIVLAVCYFGVMFMPSLGVHQGAEGGIASSLAGDWRGAFGHKNEAGAAMALFIFIGLFVARTRSLFIGSAIAVLAFVFLFFTHSKTSIIVLPLVLIVSFIMARTSRPVLGIALALAILVGLNFFSVGSLYFEPMHNLVNAVMSDPSFTGRDEVWQFAVDRIKERPFLGYGYAAFWGTPQVVYGMSSGDTSWANIAAHAHNGLLDLVLTVGIIGAALVALWLVVLPLVDFYRSPHTPDVVPLEMLFLRVCLFTAYASCFEARLLQEGEGSLFLLASAFGLRFLSMQRVSA
jgi:O-antigen ligase